MKIQRPSKIISLLTSPPFIPLSHKVHKNHHPIPQPLTSIAHIRESLDSPFRDSENLTSLKSFKPTKAHGLDGIHPLFFQKYWTIVKD